MDFVKDAVTNGQEKREKESLRSIGETARRSNAGALVVMAPDVQDLNRYENYCHPKVAPLISESVADAGLEFFDLKDTFHPYAGRETELVIGRLAGEAHINRKGHELIADTLAAELLQRGMIPPPSN